MSDESLPELDLGATVRGLTAGRHVFGRYVLQKILGRGGMGIVWLARDEELARDVALKFLPDLVLHDRLALDQLKHETNRSLELIHPHIVRVYDFVEDGENIAAISMEFVDGDNLSDLRAERPGHCFEVAELEPLIRQLCEALAYAHERARIAHRDLKPANLMLNRARELKVADFGIASTLSETVSRVSLRPTAGTIAYMSPQQLDGNPASALDDIYAVGATIYDLMTGKPPFYSANIHHQAENVVPSPMMERRKELENSGEPIPESWEETVAACLAKDPARRPQNARDLPLRLGIAAPAAPLPTNLKVAIPGSGSASVPRRAWFVEKKRPAWAAAIVLVLACTALAAWWFGIDQLGRRDENERIAQQRAAAKAEQDANKRGTKKKETDEKSNAVAGIPAPERSESTANGTSDTAEAAEYSIRLPISLKPRLQKKDYGYALEFHDSGFIDGTGRIAIEASWDGVGGCDDKLCSVQRGGKWGFVDRTGKLIVQPTWDELGSGFEGLLSVKQNGKWGFIDKSGNMVIQPLWDEVTAVEDGVANVKRNDKWGTIDRSGNVIFEPKWDRPYFFHEGLAEVERNGKHGYIDRSGRVAIDTRWDIAFDFSEGFAVVVDANNKDCFLDVHGRNVFGRKWDSAQSFSEGLAAVSTPEQNELKTVYIDHSGKVVLRPHCLIAGAFHDGLAPVEIDNKEGYIDKAGAMIIQPQFDHAYFFHKGLATVERGKKRGVIDRTGTIIIDPVWDDILDDGDGFQVRRGTKFGYVDRAGQVLIQPDYEIVWRLKTENNQTYYLVAKLINSDADGGAAELAWFDSAGKQIWNSSAAIARSGAVPADTATPASNANAPLPPAPTPEPRVGEDIQDFIGTWRPAQPQWKGTGSITFSVTQSGELRANGQFSVTSVVPAYPGNEAGVIMTESGTVDGVYYDGVFWVLTGSFRHQVDYSKATRKAARNRKPIADTSSEEHIRIVRDTNGTNCFMINLTIFRK